MTTTSLTELGRTSPGSDLLIAELASAYDPRVHETVISPSKGWAPINLEELYRGRELLFFLIWRDIKIRYKQTALGVAWAVLQPLVTLVIFSVIFGRAAKMPSEGFPYAVFAFTGLLPWTFFANGVSLASQSLVSQQSLLTKIYFPRLFIPGATIGAFVVDLAISFGLYALVLLGFGVMPSWQIVFLPFLLLLTLMATLGLGFLLAGVTVFYRDFRYVVPFMIQILLYVSPVIYPLSIFQPLSRRIMALNPMVGIIEGYRSSILGTPWDFVNLAISTVMTFALFAAGLFYFKRVERRFADFA